MFAKFLKEPSSPKASDESLPPRLLRLLPVGTKVTGRDSHPLKNSALARRTKAASLNYCLKIGAHYNSCPTQIMEPKFRFCVKFENEFTLNMVKISLDRVATLLLNNQSQIFK
jgi:hypothetical protein